MYVYEYVSTMTISNEFQVLWYTNMLHSYIVIIQFYT